MEISKQTEIKRKHYTVHQINLLAHRKKKSFQGRHFKASDQFGSFLVCTLSGFTVSPCWEKRTPLRRLCIWYLSVLLLFALRSVSGARSARPSHALFFPSPFLQAHASFFRFQVEPLKKYICYSRGCGQLRFMYFKRSILKEFKHRNSTSI